MYPNDNNMCIRLDLEEWGILGGRENREKTLIFTAYLEIRANKSVCSLLDFSDTNRRLSSGPN